jgi:predicted peroxiredoxin
MLVLIESQVDAADDAASEALEAARTLAPDSAVVLVHCGVRRALRPGATIDALLAAGVRVLADEFSLTLRGLSRERLCPGVDVVGMDEVVDLLSRDGVRAIWH